MSEEPTRDDLEAWAVNEMANGPRVFEGVIVNVQSPDRQPETLMHGGVFVDGQFVRALTDAERADGTFRIGKATPYESDAGPSTRLATFEGEG